MRPELWTTLDRLMTLAVFVACLAIIGTSLELLPGTPRANESPIQIMNDGPTITFIKPTQVGRGTPNLSVLEFSDFECPFCGRYARDVYPDLKREFVDTGKLTYEFVNFPLSIHTHAEMAAVAGECASLQNKFWEMHDWMFHNQVALDRSKLVEHAASIGLDGVQFERCLVSEQVKERIQADRLEAQRLNVSSTPTFLIATHGTSGARRVLARINGSQPYSSFKNVLEKLASRPVT